MRTEACASTRRTARTCTSSRTRRTGRTIRPRSASRTRGGSSRHSRHERRTALNAPVPTVLLRTLAGVSLIALALRAVHAQNGAECAANERLTVIDRTVSSGRNLPFRVGERLQYAASLKHVHVGSGEMQLLGRDTVRGFVT